MTPTTFTFHHKVDIQIRFNDIDMLGHVNNTKLQEYFDLGRMSYLQRIFGPAMFVDEEAIVIASMKSDFLSPVLLADKLEVLTTIFHLGNKSLKMMQHLRNVETRIVKTTCESVMVAVCKSSGQSMLIPEAWKQAIRTFEKSQELFHQ